MSVCVHDEYGTWGYLHNNASVCTGVTIHAHVHFVKNKNSKSLEVVQAQSACMCVCVGGGGGGGACSGMDMLVCAKVQ